MDEATCPTANAKGLPTTPRVSAPGYGTGMKLIEGLARQIGDKPRWSSSGAGTTLQLEFTPPPR